MKSKLNFLIDMSLKRKINSKWFKIVNIILLVAIVALANIDSIINTFGGDFDKKQEIYIIDNTDVSYDLFKQQLMLATKAEKEEDMNYLLNNYEGTIEDAKKELENKEKRDNLYIVFDNDEEKVLSVKLISYEYMDILDSQFISNYIYNRLKELGLPVYITRSTDETLNPTDRVNRVLDAFGNNDNVIVLGFCGVTAGLLDGLGVLFPPPGVFSGSFSSSLPTTLTNRVNLGAITLYSSS